jgi:hypothetical protein
MAKIEKLPEGVVIVANDADAGLGFVESTLTHVEAKVYETQYRHIVYQDIVPVSNEAGEGATSVTYYSIDGATMGKFIGSDAIDVPLADFATKQSVVPVELGATGYKYSDEELRQAAMLNRPLPALKANLAMRGYEEHAQSICFNGDATKGFSGLLNNVNVPAASVVNPGSGTAWTTKTPAQILYDINALFAQVYETTKEVEKPDTLLLPTAQWSYIASTPRSDNSDTTILQYIVQNSPYITSADNIKSLPELKGAGAAATDRMMAYTYDEDKLVFHIPLPFRIEQPVRKTLGWEVPAVYKLSGVEIRYPLSASYADGI